LPSLPARHKPLAIAAFSFIIMPPMTPLHTHGLIPDAALRAGIRHRLSEKLCKEERGDLEERERHFVEFCAALDAAPLALQKLHAERELSQLPLEFYRQVLGPRLQTSSGYWPTKQTTLAESEESMLALTSERADLKDGQKILELDSSWGALTFWMAEHFPNASITTLTHSYREHLHIETETQRRELYNIRIIAADPTFSAPESGSYDRVVSRAILEQITNYSELMRKISAWLQPEGKFFLQMLTHREYNTLFQGEDCPQGMASNFFLNDTIPSCNLPLYYQKNLTIQQHWKVSGNHYARTAEAWLRTMDENKKSLILIFQKIYGRTEARQRLASWRLFFLFCSELSNTRKGKEWFISQFLFEK
jgi:cyclopropane-fatty-acyl-phospholipid synthase